MWRAETFSSLEDKMKINVRGFSEGGAFSLVGITESQSTVTVYTANVSGEFDISYEFDPVSLAIYSGVISLYAELTGECRVDAFNTLEGEAAETEAFLKKSRGSSKRAEDKESNALFKPKKVLFVGNSILLGMFSSYGMCATDNKSDYAYHVSQRILERSSKCEFTKLFISPFEHTESKEAFDEWFYVTKDERNGMSASEYFREDLDLIILQIMDNVNTPEKKAVFKDNAPELLKRIKALSPKARILWVYGWFMKPDIVSVIEDACEKYGAETLDVSSAHTKEGEAPLKQVSISPEGEETIVKDTWITHPGNLGMKKIAELITDKLLG